MIHQIATIIMASGAEIKIELYPEAAPNTATSFMYLASTGAYKNRTIKRVVPGFVLQPSYTSFDKDPSCDFLIDNESRVNGYDNNLTLSKYAVAMGGDGESLASGSCFYIVVGDAMEKLDGKYPGFGRVISGFEEIERIMQVDTTPVTVDVPGVVVNEPTRPEIIKDITLETFGLPIGEPVKTEGILAYERK
ncbi:MULTISPECIES: peptidylprolyl isomerase [unclassified Fusibacter]|uniref:peptidylprolyl isomerase n=1 Tax=unclassified Fusibacter TaxID=2624464 RepID=UPI0010103B92|nr:MULTISPECIES: peptidylprolyl isomerase [unclassified Fusibacter]MCK8061483.1 peptidylprolyl isomerase [Fusibacter sp. A2]NPE23668.1 peptidylprolyl isomerase [Fusibacter sp. A1]RXV58847.1 peptidylprolyl isomerase [Fusibacter sp. A1]